MDNLSSKSRRSSLVNLSRITNKLQNMTTNIHQNTTSLGDNGSSSVTYDNLKFLAYDHIKPFLITDADDIVNMNMGMTNRRTQKSVSMSINNTSKSTIAGSNPVTRKNSMKITVPKLKINTRSDSKKDFEPNLIEKRMTCPDVDKSNRMDLFEGIDKTRTPEKSIKKIYKLELKKGNPNFTKISPVKMEKVIEESNNNTPLTANDTASKKEKIRPKLTIGKKKALEFLGIDKAKSHRLDKVSPYRSDDDVVKILKKSAQAKLKLINVASPQNGTEHIGKLNNVISPEPYTGGEGSNLTSTKDITSLKESTKESSVKDGKSLKNSTKGSSAKGYPFVSNKKSMDSFENITLQTEVADENRDNQTRSNKLGNLDTVHNSIEILAETDDFDVKKAKISQKRKSKNKAVSVDFNPNGIKVTGFKIVPKQDVMKKQGSTPPLLLSSKATPLTLTSEPSQANYIQVRPLYKTSGDIATARLRTKTKSFDDDTAQSILKSDLVFRKSTIKRDISQSCARSSTYFQQKEICEALDSHQNEKMKSEHLSKFQFSKKNSYYKRNENNMKSFRTPRIFNNNSITPEAIEKDFLKAYNRVIKGNPIQTQNTLSSNMGLYTETSQDYTMRRVNNTELIPFEEFLKQDVDGNITKSIQDIDNQFSLPSLTELNSQTARRGSRQREKSQNISNLQLSDKSMQISQNKENFLVIEINPPDEKFISPILEAHSHMEESGPQSVAIKDQPFVGLSAQKITKIYNISAVRTSKSDVYSQVDKTNRTIIEERLSTLNDVNSSIVSNNRIFVDDHFRRNAEGVFKFDEIYPSYIDNLNVKSQKLRIKSNFFSFLEGIIDNLILKANDLLKLDRLLLSGLPKRQWEHIGSKFDQILNDPHQFDLNKDHGKDLTEDDITKLKTYFNNENQSTLGNGYYDDDSEQRQKNKDGLVLLSKEKLSVKISGPQDELKLRQSIDGHPIMIGFGFLELMDLMTKYLRSEPTIIMGYICDDKDLALKQQYFSELLITMNAENFYFVKKTLLKLHKGILNGHYEHTMSLDTKEPQDHNGANLKHLSVS